MAAGSGGGTVGLVLPRVASLSGLDGAPTVPEGSDKALMHLGDPPRRCDTHPDGTSSAAAALVLRRIDVHPLLTGLGRGRQTVSLRNGHLVATANRAILSRRRSRLTRGRSFTSHLITSCPRLDDHQHRHPTRCRAEHAGCTVATCIPNAHDPAPGHQTPRWGPFRLKPVYTRI
ncbi:MULTISPECIES: hypothetical protein [Mycobacterium tuberculosis complex]|uniref:hypothetical protein n=1 Tax=Mycobacterium tuberculosis complex TaxID=77643 RepID=UPI0001C59664|nr:MULTISPECIES: hypothetical protein [Mycobacterium tuberculosis complex]EFD58553.1 hypothetical protein TBDG_00746 [Mycobacterium tuberculosis T92]KBF42681.1 hypothetical protein BM96_01356 [Mycobacterium tuberculosis T92]KBK13119.1 hypothetical protein Q641_01728 [Mycobacterium tuberculosis OFXR-32]